MDLHSCRTESFNYSNNKMITMIMGKIKKFQYEWDKNFIVFTLTAQLYSTSIQCEIDIS